MGLRSNQSEPVSIFLSYAHKDAAACDALRSRLQPLEADNLVRVWYDNHIRAGDEYSAEIDSRLRTAKLILLLVSKAFLESQYCRDKELPAALAQSEAGTARLVPLILSPCDWSKARFTHLQVVPRDGKTISELGEEGWKEVLAAIRRAMAIPGLEEFLAAQEHEILQDARAKIEVRSAELTSWAKLRALLVEMRVFSGALPNASPEVAREAERARASGDADDGPDAVGSDDLLDLSEPRKTLLWDNLIRRWRGWTWRGVLLGDPGFGKTALLWRTVCEINSQAIDAIREGREPPTIAVYCTATHLAESLPNRSVELVIQHAHGWIKERLDGLLLEQKPAIISTNEFNREILAFLPRCDFRTMVTSMAGLPSSEQVEAEKARTYVRQLEIVDLDDDVILQSINEYLRASVTRTKLAEQGIVHEDSFVEYHEALMAFWRNKKRQNTLTHILHKPESLGQLLFSDCCLHKEKLQGLEMPAYFTPGSYHTLADDETIGWHPDYQVKLRGASA
jgi:hypothetical protein